MPGLIITLIVVNIPVYLLLGWLLFDSKETAADTFIGTLIAIAKIAFVPPIIRVLMGWDDTDALGVFPIIGFFIACGAVTYGEYFLFTRYVFPVPVEAVAFFV
jgi:hypothetical protein